MAKLNLSMLDEYYEMRDDILMECEGFIYDFLKEHGNHVETYNDDTNDYVGGEIIFVFYDDDDDHARSEIGGLFIDENDDKIYLEIEGCELYDIERCSSDEIINIAEYLNENIKEFDEMEK